MDTPIPYLEGLILASAVYPSGFSYALFTSLRGGPPRTVSTAFLATLALPFFTIGLAAGWLRPESVLAWRGFTTLQLLAAAALAPLALAVEFAIHALRQYRKSGAWPRGIELPGFWRARLSTVDWCLVGLIVVGEEFLYRAVWIDVLHRSMGLSGFAAVGISSLAYGLNHFAFGTTSILSKSISGCLYGTLYVMGNGSIVLPIVTHGLQNLALFGAARRQHA